MLLSIQKTSQRIITKLRTALNALILGTLFFCLPEQAFSAPMVEASASFVSDNRINIHLNIPEGWKLYAHDPGDVGKPLEVNINSLPDTSYQILWPAPNMGHEYIGDSDLIYYYYSDSLDIPINIDTPATGRLEIAFKYGLCNTTCISEQQTISLSPVKPTLTSLTYILLAAFLGGAILNLMPCVLPVLALKAHSIATHRYSRKNSLFSIAGIVFTFLIISMVAIILKHTGQTLGWGLHFQNHYFTIFLALLMLLFGFYLLLDYNFRLPSFLGRLSFMTESKTVQVQHFASGVISVIFATPCTAPFLGAALAYAVTANSLEILAIFLLISLGFSSPYFVFLAISKPNKIVPKAGAWLNIFRKLLSLPMFISAIWLFVVSYENFHTEALVNDAPEEKIEKLLKVHKGVLVNVTANWCLTCKYNEHVILSSNSLQKALKDTDIAVLTLDYSRSDPSIQKFLDRYGSAGIPFSIIITEHSVSILPELLTFEAIAAAISQVL